MHAATLLSCCAFSGASPAWLGGGAPPPPPLQRGRTLVMDLEGERRIWLRLARTAFELAGETKPAAALAMQGGKFTEARKLLLAVGEGGRRAAGQCADGRQPLLCRNLGTIYLLPVHHHAC